jgi:hypothetical protein
MAEHLHAFTLSVPFLPPLSAMARCRQLFVQAAIADPLLRAKVASWAHSSGGLLPAEPSDSADGPAPGYIGGDDLATVAAVLAAGQAGRGPRVKWARLKTAARATEKLVRSYRQEITARMHAHALPPPSPHARTHARTHAQARRTHTRTRTHAQDGKRGRYEVMRDGGTWSVTILPSVGDDKDTVTCFFGALLKVSFSIYKDVSYRLYRQRKA